eukprot:6210441-Pleurochrysis_carterae.AAC.1
MFLCPHCAQRTRSSRRRWSVGVCCSLAKVMAANSHSFTVDACVASRRSMGAGPQCYRMHDLSWLMEVRFADSRRRNGCRAHGIDSRGN